MSRRVVRSRKPRRAPGWQMRADICETLAAHYGDADAIVRSAQVIIHFIDTGLIKGDRSGIKAVPDQVATQ